MTSFMEVPWIAIFRRKFVGLSNRETFPLNFAREISQGKFKNAFRLNHMDVLCYSQVLSSL